GSLISVPTGARRRSGLRRGVLRTALAFCPRTGTWRLGLMQDRTPAASSIKLDESQLIEELKRLRTQIPDNPSINPILNVAFELSRRLESGAVSFDEMKALAGRLMDMPLGWRGAPRSDTGRY